MEVFGQPAGMDRFRYNHIAELRMPAQHDLRYAAAMLVSNAGQHGVFEQPSAPKRAPGFGDDVMLGMEVAQGFLLEVRVQLDLVNNGQNAGFIQQLLKVTDIEIADAYGFGTAFVVQLDHAFPGFDKKPLLGNRPVNQIQIDVVKVELFQAFVEGDFGYIVTVRSEEHTSELQSLMRISYAVFCLKK